MHRSNSGVARVIIVIAVIIVLIVAVMAAITLQSKPKTATQPQASPTASPTSSGSSPSPTSKTSPTAVPITTPTTSPTHTTSPTAAPTTQPTQAPTVQPTASPSPTPKPTASPSPNPTPTSTPSGKTHTVDYTTMMTGNEIDYWNQTVSSSYTVTLKDTMSVGTQPDQLGIMAESSLNDANSNQWIWNVNFVNSTFFYYWVNTGGGNGPQGHLNTVGGSATVVVTSTYIEFIGSGTGQYYSLNYSGSYSFNNVFETLAQIQTSNGGNGANFTSGNLTIEIQ